MSSFFLYMNTTISSSSQIQFVNIAKGFAILCVVLGHFTPSYMPELGHLLKDSVYLFHMPLFMCLAGFLFGHSLESRPISFIPFIGKKARRLMLPYFFLSFCIAGLNFVLQHFIPVKRPVDFSYLCELFYQDVGGSATFLWFLYTLFLIFTVSAVCVRSKTGIAILVLLSVILPFCSLPSVCYLSSVAHYLPYFVVGWGLFSVWKHHPSRLSSLWTLLCAAVVFISAILLPCDTSFSRILQGYACGLSVSLCIVNLSIRKRSAPLFECLGAYSSYIYLLHMAGVYLVRLVYEKIGIFNEGSYIIALCAAICVGTVIPVLLYKTVLRRMPWLLFMMGKGKKKKKSLVDKGK